MPAKKKEENTKYRYILVIECTECGTKAVNVGPCVKCGNTSFHRIYEVEEIK